jgi:RHS repeat-associated protein
MKAHDGVYPDMLLIGNPWGHIIREYDNSNNDPTRNKFTGKERDWESGYDYFGARYYNARIGRWGQVEPLLENYFSLSPYQYGSLNPLRFVDVDGRELYLYGDDAEDAFNRLRSKSSLNMHYNKKSGKVTVYGTPGKNASESDKLLYAAITGTDYNANIFCVSEHVPVYNDKHGVDYWVGGAFVGKGTQLICLKDFERIEELSKGDENYSVENSVLHEVIEAIVGAMNPKFGYLDAHSETNRKLGQNDKGGFTTGPIGWHGIDDNHNFNNDHFVTIGIVWHNATNKLYIFDNYKLKESEYLKK